MANIIWLTEQFPPNKGGMSLSCERITKNLGQNGLKINIIHFTQKKVTSYKIEENTLGTYMPCFVNDDEPHALNLTWIALQERAKKEHFTHLVAFGGHLPMLAAPIFSDWLDIPLITMVRDDNFDAAIFSTQKREIFRHAFLRSVTVCATSKDKVKKINSLYKEVNATYIPNGVTISDWGINDYIISKSKTVLSESSKMCIGLFGQLKVKKGIPFFLDAIKKSGLIHHIRLLIVGDIAIENYDELEQIGIEFKHVPFLEKDELAPYYYATDIIAVPSYYEGMPNVLLEGGMMGKPFIASNIDGMKDVLTDKEHGFLFPTGNTEKCIEALKDAVQTESSRLIEMGNTLRLHIQEQYSAEKEAQRYLNILG